MSSLLVIRFLRRSLFHSLYFISVVSYIHHLRLHSIAIKPSGDIEQNLGPKPDSCDTLSICQWNLSSTFGHNFINLSLLRDNISINKFDVVCLSEASQTQVFHPMMTTWSYQDIIQYAQIIRLILKKAVFELITIILYP